MKTVLIATERDLEQNLLAQSLEGEGYAIMRSRDGLDALELARSTAPQLLLLNVVLPKLDGFALFRRCQQDEQLRQIPVVLFSTRSKDEKSSRFAQELGVTYFVVDALRSTALAMTVVEALATESTALLPALVINASSLTKLSPVAVDPQPVPFVAPAPKQAPPALNDELEQQLFKARSLANLFDSSPVSMWIVDKSSQRIMAANAAAAQLFGYSPTEMLQLKSHSLLRADSSAQGGATQVLSFQHKDGHGLSLLLNVRDIEFNGHAAELMAAQDVSYRVRGERAMADEIQRLKLLLMALPVAYGICDTEGQLREVNDAACRLLGKTREQLLGQSMVGLFAEPMQWPVLRDLPVGQASTSRLTGDASGSQPVVITRGMVEVGAGLSLYSLHIEMQRALVPVTSQAAAKLSAMMEVMRYAEDADEVTLLQYAMAQLAQAFNSPLAMFATLEGVTQTMQVLAVSQHQSLRRNQHAVADRIVIPAVWRSLLTSRLVHVGNAPDESLLVEGLPEISTFQVCSIASVTHEPWLLLIGNREAAYTTAEQAELQHCAELLSMVLLSKRQQLLAHATRQRQASVAIGAVGLLEKLIDQYDVYAATSGTRVANLTVAIARQMSLSEGMQTRLQLAARLHDIGHLLLPQALLLRPSGLSAAEQMVLQSHAERGAHLLRSADLGADIADIVAQHHERLDGSGYPAGLHGEQINIEARILAVADVVEAMCATRAYRPALGLTAALAEIHNGAGVLYDVVVVDACQRVFKQTNNQWPD